ncbi:MAG: class I SAM-dependent methyltransferase [Fimbriiglobus sp.]
MLGLIRDPAPDHPAIRELRARLDQFYASVDGYTAFEHTPNRDPLYGYLCQRLRGLGAGGRTPRVLELGAGRTGFPEYLRQAGLAVDFTAQDVTPKNRDHLAAACQAVVVGDIADVPGEFDLILSTYVFEHVASPRQFLEAVDRRLAPGGSHVVVCPRYDAPGYVCPSLRHHGPARRAAFAVLLAASRVLTAIDRRPRFWVNPDPAMFHQPWFRDADAIHIVSQLDVEAWHRAQGYRVVPTRLPSRGRKEVLRDRLITVSLDCRKPGAS